MVDKFLNLPFSISDESESTKILESSYNGPDLLKGRNRHSCGFLRQNDRKYVVVVGGHSVEISRFLYH